MAKQVALTRDVTREECPWLNRDFVQNELVWIDEDLVQKELALLQVSPGKKTYIACGIIENFPEFSLPADAIVVEITS